MSESIQEHWPEPPWARPGTVPQSSSVFARGGSGPWLLLTAEELRNYESYQRLPKSSNWNRTSFLVSVLITRAEGEKKKKAR